MRVEKVNDQNDALTAQESLEQLKEKRQAQLQKAIGTVKTTKPKAKNKRKPKLSTADVREPNLFEIKGVPSGGHYYWA